MERPAHRLLKNLKLLPEAGRQRCFELGKFFYYQHSDDATEPGNERRNYWRKELPAGELFLVTLLVEEVKGETYSVKDTIIRQLK